MARAVQAVAAAWGGLQDAEAQAAAGPPPGARARFRCHHPRDARLHWRTAVSRPASLGLSIAWASGLPLGLPASRQCALRQAPPASGQARGGLQPRPASANNWQICSGWPAGPPCFAHRCDSIHVSWKAPANVGRWSPVTDYAVFIEATELVPFEDSLPSATDDAAVRALPHKVASCTHMLHVLLAHIHTCVFSTVASQVAYRQTNLDLTGLVPSTEYTAMVLPRNGKGWGSRWSEPLRATTEPAVLPPQKAAAPAVRPGEGCKAVYVRVPTASIGCHSLVNCREPVRVVAAGPGSCGSSRRT